MAQNTLKTCRFRRSSESKFQPFFLKSTEVPVSNSLQKFRNQNQCLFKSAAPLPALPWSVSFRPLKSRQDLYVSRHSCWQNIWTYTFTDICVSSSCPRNHSLSLIYGNCKCFCYLHEVYYESKRNRHHYHLISIWPGVPAKIMESSVASTISSNIERHDLTSKQQWAFKEGTLLDSYKC